MKEIYKAVKDFTEARGWDKPRVSDTAKSLIIEAAEVLELFQWNEMTIPEAKKNKELLKNLSHELADVLIYATHLGVLLDIDLKKAVFDKLEIQSKKYPVKLVSQSGSKKDNATRSAKYWEIKKQHRLKNKK